MVFVGLLCLAFVYPGIVKRRIKVGADFDITGWTAVAWGVALLVVGLGCIWMGIEQRVRDGAAR